MTTFLLTLTHPIATFRWSLYRHPFLWSLFVWCVLSGLVAGWTRGLYAELTLAGCLLVWRFLVWRRRRLGLYRKQNLDPAGLHRLVGRYLLELLTVFFVQRAWWSALSSLKLTGHNNLVPRLGHVTSDLNNDLTGYVQPGSIGADVDKLSQAAPKIAGFVRLGCKDVSVHITSPGNARVRLTFSAAFDQILALEDLPRSPAGTLAYGIRRNGQAAWIWSHMSAIFGGLTRKGKSVLCKTLIAAAIRDRLWLNLYIADTKRGIELHEFAAELGDRHGTTVQVVRYESTPQGADKMVKAMQAEMDARADYMKAHGLKQHIPTQEQPQLVGIFDETLPLHEMLKLGTKSAAGEIGFAGAAMCISLWINCQVGHANIIGALRELIPQRISFSTPTWQITETILGAGAWTENGAACHMIGNTPGIGWSSAEDEAKPQPFRSANTTAAEALGIAKGIIPAKLLEPPKRAHGARAVKVRKSRSTVEPFVLYVAWDDSAAWRKMHGARPVYVGISNDWDRRRKEHAKRDRKWCDLHRRMENYWLVHALRVEVEQIGTVTRTHAERVEKGRIHRARPVFNHMHNRRRHLTSWLPSMPTRTPARKPVQPARPTSAPAKPSRPRTRPPVPAKPAPTVDAHRLEHFDGAWSE